MSTNGILWKSATAMGLLCLLCQLLAVKFLREAETPDTPPATAAETSIPGSPAAMHPAEGTGRALRAVERTANRQARKLRRLENQQDFLNFTKHELEIVEALKRDGGYLDASVSISIDTPNLLERVNADRQREADRQQEALDCLEAYMANADFSALSSAEFALLKEYLEARRQWYCVASEDLPDPEQMYEAAKTCRELWEKVFPLTLKAFDAQYGNSYQLYQSEYQNAGLESLFRFANPWWINRSIVSFTDDGGASRTYRIKLFE